MQYMAGIKNYVSKHAGAIENTALTGLTAIVLAVLASGCAISPNTAQSSGGEISLLKYEWGKKVTNSTDPQVQGLVVLSSPNYSEEKTPEPKLPDKIPEGFGGFVLRKQ